MPCAVRELAMSVMIEVRVTWLMLTVSGQAACSCDQEIVRGGKFEDAVAGGEVSSDGDGDCGVGRQR
jgi:hypothetical protein